MYYAEIQKEMKTVADISSILLVELLSHINYVNVYKYLLISFSCVLSSWISLNLVNWHLGFALVFSMLLFSLMQRAEILKNDTNAKVRRFQFLDRGCLSSVHCMGGSSIGFTSN